MTMLHKVPELRPLRETAQPSSGRKWHWLYLPGACALLVAFFVSLGTPLSKIGLICEFDALLNPSARFARFTCIFDPSIYQLQAPLNILTERFWKSGSIPLWNPLNGCGYPMIGDPQTLAFAPLNFLFPVSNAGLYEIGILAKILIGAAGVFMLARTLRLSNLSACFACLSYSLCPYYLWHIELPLNYFFYPVVCWLFAKLACAPTVGRSLLTGVACSLIVLSIHPECALFSVSYGALLCLLLASFDKRAGDNSEWTARLFSAIKAVSLVAITVFCLTAPMTFPFLEFLANSTNYKSETLQMGAYPLPWFALVLGLIQPVFAYESPFLGIVAIGLIPLAILRANRFVAALLVVAAASLVMVTHLGPAAMILGKQPLSVLLPVYCLPVFLLMMAVTGGYGLQVLFDTERRSGKLAFVVGCFLLVGVMPFCIEFCAQHFSAIPLYGQVPPFQQPMLVDSSAWWDSILAIAGVCLLVFAFGSSRKLHWLFPVLLIALNVASQYKMAALAMYPFSNYEYRESRPLRFLSDSGARSLATGLNLFLPNNNQRFGISDFRLYNPLYPDRYLNFIRAAGAEKYDLYFHGFKNPMSKLLDIASVRYVMSRQPVVAESDQAPPTETILTEENEPTVFYSSLFDPGILLIRGELAYSPGRSAIFGRLMFRPTEGKARDIVAQPLLLNDAGDVLWSGDRINIWPNESGEGRREINFVLPVDRSVRPGTAVTAGLRVAKFGGVYQFEPVSSSFSTRGTVVLLKKFVVSKSQDAVDSHQAEGGQRRGAGYQQQFLPVLQASNGVTIYENTRALGQAYLVHQSQIAESEGDALEMISSDNFNPSTQVVLESKPSTEKTMTENQAGNERVELTRPDNNTVDISVSAKMDGYLVLTDTFYPGWNAYLDDRKVPILRANYLFRAIHVPAGSHHVRFVYEPLPFRLGAVLAGTFLLFAGALLACRAVCISRCDRNEKSPEDPKR